MGLSGVVAWRVMTVLSRRFRLVVLVAVTLLLLSSPVMVVFSVMGCVLSALVGCSRVSWTRVRVTHAWVMGPIVWPSGRVTVVAWRLPLLVRGWLLRVACTVTACASPALVAPASFASLLSLLRSLSLSLLLSLSRGARVNTPSVAL